MSTASAFSMPAIVALKIGRPPPFRIERCPVLATVEVGDAEPRHQVLEREDFLDRGEVARDRPDALRHSA